MTSKIVEDLRPLAVEIGRVRPDPGNARRHPQTNLNAIQTSLEIFGQRKPIVCSPNGIIRAGNGTWLAARSLGWDEIAVVWVEEDEQSAVEYSLADNRTSDLSHFDPEAIKAALASTRERIKAMFDRFEPPSPVVVPALSMAGEGIEEKSLFTDQPFPLEEADDSSIPAHPQANKTALNREQKIYHFEFEVGFDEAILIDRGLKEWERTTGRKRGDFLVVLAEMWLKQ